MKHIIMVLVGSVALAFIFFILYVCNEYKPLFYFLMVLAPAYALGDFIISEFKIARRFK